MVEESCHSIDAITKVACTDISSEEFFNRYPDERLIEAVFSISTFSAQEEYENIARGINKVILVGNLGADPETRYMPSGGAVTNVRIATSDSWRDKQSGEQRERTEWHRVVFFNRLAEIAAEYLRKGSQIYIEGRLQTRKWQGQDGQDRYTTEIVANEMQMLGGRGGGSAPSAPPDDWGEPMPATASSGGGSRGGDDFDDDIPF